MISIKQNLFLVIISTLASLTLACGAKEVTTAKTEQEALQMMDVLHENGFEVSKVKVGEAATTEYQIKVAQDLFGDDNVLMATRVLRDNGYPRPASVGGEGAYQNQGFVSAESAQAAQRLKERETEIERQLYTLPNVVSADVNIVLAEPDALNFKPTAASASVVVVHKEPKFALPTEQIQEMVSKSVPNLQAANVSVALTAKESRPLPRTSAEVRRRNNLLLAAGVGFILVLGAISLIFFLQTRRRHKMLAAVPALEEATDVGVIDDAPRVEANRWLAESNLPPTDETSDTTPDAARPTG